MSEWLTNNVLISLIGVGGFSALLKLIISKFNLIEKINVWFDKVNDESGHWVMTLLKPKIDAGALWLGRTLTDWFQQSPNPIMKLVNVAWQYLIEPLLVPFVLGLGGLLNVFLDALKAICISAPAKFVSGLRHDNPKK